MIDGPVQYQSDCEQKRNADGEGNKRVYSKGSERPEGCIAAEHQQLAMSDVQHLQNAENQCQSHRGNSINTSYKQTKHKRLRK